MVLLCNTMISEVVHKFEVIFSRNVLVQGKILYFVALVFVTNELELVSNELELCV